MDWLLGDAARSECLTNAELPNVLQSNRLLKIENLESLVMLEQLYLSDNGIEVIEGLDTLVGNWLCYLHSGTSWQQPGFIIRSTSESPPNNIEGKNVRPPVRPYVHKKFQFEWNLVYR